LVDLGTAWHYPEALVETVSFTDVTYGSACRATMDVGCRTVGDGPVPVCLLHGGPHIGSMFFDDAWASYRTFAIAGFLNFLTPGDTVQTEEYNTEVG
jgi:hypothetical protein